MGQDGRKSRTPRAWARLAFRGAMACGLILCVGCALSPQIAGLRRPKEITPFGPREAPVANTSAPGPELKGKRVVVVAGVTPSLKAEFPSLDRELTRQVVARLMKRGELFDPEKVFEWVDAHPHWTDPEEIAKEFQADLVIVLEVESFRLRDSEDSPLFQGAARTHVSVTETTFPVFRNKKVAMQMPEQTRLVYTQDCETTYPTRPVDPASGVTAEAFRKKLLAAVATELSWQFVGPSPGDELPEAKSGK